MSIYSVAGNGAKAGIPGSEGVLLVCTANSSCPIQFQYKENKSYCEDLTEGKFSFPLIHGIRSNPQSTKIMSILLS